MTKLYARLIKTLGWSLSQIEESDFESLMDFIFFEDPDVKVVGGKTYRRAQGVPSWL